MTRSQDHTNERNEAADNGVDQPPVVPGDPDPSTPLLHQVTPPGTAAGAPGSAGPAWWRRSWVVGLIAALAGMALGAGIAGGASDSPVRTDAAVQASGKAAELTAREARVSAREREADHRDQELAALAADLGERERKISEAEQEAAGTTVTDGVWVVGVDIVAGIYRTTEPVGSDCYWAIFKTGTNGEVIVSNDLPGGGRPQVTLRTGQDFQTSDCGTWKKIK